MNQKSRLLIVVLLSSSGLASAAAGHVVAGPAAESAGRSVRAWSAPYNPVSVGMVTGLQGFLRTGAGVGVLDWAPAFGVIGRLSPESEAHRRIVGAMSLPAGFEARLRAAAQAPDDKALTGEVVAALSASYGRNAAGRIDEAVQARAGEIAAAVGGRRISAAELSAAASELAPFASISAKARAVEEMAAAARSEKTMAAARRIAAALASGKGDAGERSARELARAEGIPGREGAAVRLRPWPWGPIRENGADAAMTRQGPADVPAPRAPGRPDAWPLVKFGAFLGAFLYALKAVPAGMSNEVLAVIWLTAVLGGLIGWTKGPLYSGRIDAWAFAAVMAAMAALPFLAPAPMIAGAALAVGGAYLAMLLTPGRPDAWPLVKFGAFLGAFLAALKAVPAGMSNEALAVIWLTAVLGGLIGWTKGPLYSGRIDAWTFAAVMAAMAALLFLAPAPMIAGAALAVGGAYLAMLLML